MCKPIKNVVLVCLDIVNKRDFYIISFIVEATFYFKYYLHKKGSAANDFQEKELNSIAFCCTNQGPHCVCEEEETAPKEQESSSHGVVFC